MALGFPSLRVDRDNALHHLWCNNGTWWVHYTLHFGHRKRRIRRSLETSTLDEAVRRRDRFTACGGSPCHRRFARGKPPPTVAETAGRAADLGTPSPAATSASFALRLIRLIAASRLRARERVASDSW